MLGFNKLREIFDKHRILYKDTTIIKETECINEIMTEEGKLSVDTGELIICSAIQYKCGMLIRGHRHYDCIRNANERQNPPDAKGAIMGFMTSENRFVERKEGAEIQRVAGIKSVWTKDGTIGKILFSEDLY